MKAVVLELVAVLGFSSVASANGLDVAAKAIESKGVTDWVKDDPGHLPPPT